MGMINSSTDIKILLIHIVIGWGRLGWKNRRRLLGKETGSWFGHQKYWHQNQLLRIPLSTITRGHEASQVPESGQFPWVRFPLHCQSWAAGASKFIVVQPHNLEGSGDMSPPGNCKGLLYRQCHTSCSLIVMLSGSAFCRNSQRTKGRHAETDKNIIQDTAKYLLINFSKYTNWPSQLPTYLSAIETRLILSISTD